MARTVISTADLKGEKEAYADWKSQHGRYNIKKKKKSEREREKS